MDNPVKEKLIKELHRPARIKFRRRRYNLKGINDLWEADLIDFVEHKKRNKGYQYILIVIDAFSKYAYAESIKNKSGAEVTRAMRKILRASKPKLLQTDQGKEFYNTHFQGLMKEKGIRHYSTYSSIKAAHVERLIRTIKTKLYQRFHLQGSYYYLNILQDVIDEYNNDKHRTIGMAPSQVNKSNESQILSKYKALPPFDSIKKHAKQVLKKDDYVRISRHRGVFDKGYLPNYSTEVFKIMKVKTTKPQTYILQDLKGNPIQGGFYNEELKKTIYKDIYLVEKILKKRNNRYLVKWLGFETPTWEPVNNIIN